MKIAKLSKAGTRCDLTVKVVEVVMSAEHKSARVCQVLVADETACVLLLASGSSQVDAMVPGALLQLHNVLLDGVADHTGKTVVMLRLDRFAQCGVAAAMTMLVKLDKNISYVQHEVVFD
jgi:hypothetical protein